MNAHSPTYESLRRDFRWNIPSVYNIALECCDRQRPSRVALRHLAADDEVRSYTFGDLKRLSDRFANALRHLGIERGDRVGIVVPQSPETAVAHLATYKLGAVALPLSALFGPDALKFRLANAGAKAVVVDKSGLDKVESIRSELPDLESIVAVDTGRVSSDGVHDLWEQIRAGSSSFQPVETSADDPALLIYTSGTTGPPKGVLHAHRVLLGHLPGFDLSHDFFPQDGDHFWTPADWAWIGGLMDALLPSWHHGVPVLTASRRNFEPEWALKIMAEERVRNVFLPPTALKILRRSDLGAKGARLRSIMSGGEMLGEEMLAWARATFGVIVNEIYGQTEVNYIVGNCSTVWGVRPGSMGLPYPGHDVAVLDDAGEAARRGEPGEIAVRAPDPVMFLKYWERPEATREKFRDGWVLTGDLAVADEDGYLWFQGRRDDVINSAGYRIGPAEVEECLIRHDAVAMAAVIGVPDEIRGEAVKAFIMLREGCAPSRDLEDEIRRHVKDRVAAYQYPRAIEFVDDLPMTTTGKIQRAELRKLEAQRRREAEP